MNAAERNRFDKLVESVLADLPAAMHNLLEEVPLLVEDTPDPALLKTTDCKAEEICGLHSGLNLAERSVEDLPEIPETIHLFRVGILEIAGGWDTWQDEDGTPMGGVDVVREEIRITLLHEIGHHFGLDEDQLERLGFA
ncbi:MAG: metallopeptidase family protein [Phycisphaerales bacterium]|nr:metallopeptidase family protein [Phycisphaerales bacterium]